MAGWKIPTFEDGIGALIGSVPKVIKFFKDQGRIKKVEKITDAVHSSDDAVINKQLRDIVGKEDKRDKANS